MNVSSVNSYSAKPVFQARLSNVQVEKLIESAEESGQKNAIPKLYTMLEHLDTIKPGKEANFRVEDKWPLPVGYASGYFVHPDTYLVCDYATLGCVKGEKKYVEALEDACVEGAKYPHPYLEEPSAEHTRMTRKEFEKISVKNRHKTADDVRKLAYSEPVKPSAEELDAL